MSERGLVAVVTGANRGIGREVCRQLADRGYEVILGARDPDKGARAAAELGVDSCQLDVADEASVATAAAWVEDRLGRCDVLVNNAAILYDTWAHARSADLDEVRAALETNLLGAWRTTFAFLPLLRRSPRPRIVNVSSESGSLTGM